MNTVNSNEEFLSMFDKDGKPTEPFSVAEGCVLSGLNSVTSLDGVALAEGCMLYDLSDSVVLSANPTPEEMEIIKQIPIDEIDMGSWHCGTSHCLAGWAQVISGRAVDDETAHSDGCELLPSLSHLFFAPDKPVRDLIERLQSN